LKIAIIGAGLSGANLYRLLDRKKYHITIFEKSRGAGGRCSTRYINDKFIDHGTPYFQAKNKEFKNFCDGLCQDNILHRKENIYYPTRGMNQICSAIIDKENLISNTKIVSCSFENKMWSLKDQNNVKYEGFDKLIITIPAPQVLQLDIDLSSPIKQKLQLVQYDSIATLMCYAYTTVNIMDPKLFQDVSFKKIINNSSKYNFENFSSYVIHLSENLSNENNFSSKEEVKKYITKKLFEISKIDFDDEFYTLAHLWRYAFVSQSIKEDYLYDESLSLGICGDYFNGKDLEGAFLSSLRLFERLV